ncbi:hypothetical protein PYV61_26345, partial [Roseisolibacter sp. H3M3-2]
MSTPAVATPAVTSRARPPHSARTASVAASTSSRAIGDTTTRLGGSAAAAREGAARRAATSAAVSEPRASGVRAGSAASSA